MMTTATMMMMLMVLLVALAPSLTAASTSLDPRAFTRVRPMANGGSGGAAPHPLLFEISTRPWLYALSLKYNQPGMMLRDVPVSEYKALAAEGIQAVWLMGMWQLGPYGLHHDRTDPTLLATYAKVLPGYTMADIIGSPYSITNYTVNTEIGTPADLANTRKILNGLGMKLMLDLVPNHSAIDAGWTTSRPQMYVQKPSSGTWPSDWWVQWQGHTFAFGRDPYDGAWTDVAQFNYWEPATVAAMTNALMTIAASADMVRCDMAMLILNDVIEATWGTVMSANGYSRPSTEFWRTAIAKVKAQYPDFQMMAESYDYPMCSPCSTTLVNYGFDYTYDKGILDNLYADNLDNLRSDVASHNLQFFDHSAHFVENHDQPRAAAALGGDQQAFIGSVIISTLPGLRLYYFGQFKGYKNKLDVHLRRALPEATNTTVEGLYHQLLDIVSDDIFHTGTWTNIDTSTSGTEWRLVAWRWASASGDEHRLCVINYSNVQGWGNVVVADAQGENGGDTVTLTELFSNTTYTRSASTMRSSGLTVGVNAWGAQIFTY